MSTIYPITRERYAGQRWNGPANLQFAATQTLLPVSAHELSQMAVALPMAFAAKDGGYVLTAVLGLQNDRNLFIAPDGRWVGSYLPALLRTHPFCMKRNSRNEPVLCIDEAAGLLSDTGNRFYEEDGTPAQQLTNILASLAHTDQGLQQSAQAVALLNKHGLLKPMPLTVASPNGEVTIGGLFQVDEAALRALPGNALEELAQRGVLTVAYSQLLSMPR